MNLKKLNIVIFLTLFVTSCISTGKDFNSGYVKFIKNGSTTKQELIQELGEPNRKGMENQDELWIFEYNDYKLGETYSKDLQIIFDDQGVVKAYNFSSNFPGEKSQ